MITTRESINFQFSLIFGYSSPKDIIVGDIIGPGKLTRERVAKLSQKVIRFLRMYNAMLRDFAGSELFAIEFSLDNIEKKNSQIMIYPKSMILVPGKYKDCESLLLALKPETGYLNIHESKKSLDGISELFYEVEEFAEHPQLEINESKLVLKKFASRFGLKLYGELVEDKWNKKLIGINTTLPTDKEKIEKYGQIDSSIEILWNKKPFEFNIGNLRYKKKKSKLDEILEIEHLKYMISEPSAAFIIENSLKLGADLIDLANTGTIDEIQDRLIHFLLNKIKAIIAEDSTEIKAKKLIENVNHSLGAVEMYFGKFFKYSREFLKIGESGNLELIIKKLSENMRQKAKAENEDFEELIDIASSLIERSIFFTEKVKAIDLKSTIVYFNEIFSENIKIIKKTTPIYLARRRIFNLIQTFIKLNSESLEREQKPAKVIGRKILTNFEVFLKNKLELVDLREELGEKYEEEKIDHFFIRTLEETIVAFFQDTSLKISDLISFAEIMMSKDSNFIKKEIERFTNFENEIHYLFSYILRDSTINRFLKLEPDKEITDPVTFSSKFHRFLQKRIGGINLVWKDYILSWITDYAKKFFNLEEQKEWILKDVYNDFLEYIEERERLERSPEHFIHFLDKYIGEISGDMKKNILFEFLKQYELCLDIKTEFPKYLKNILKKNQNELNFDLRRENPLDYLENQERNTLYDFIKENELKYYSKLIPKPTNLILKHIVDNDNKEMFKNDLYHIFKFHFGDNRLKIDLTDNFREIFKHWVKEK